MIILIIKEKSIWKNSASIYDKTLSKLRMEENKQYVLSTVVVTNYHKFSSLKQHKLALLQFCSKYNLINVTGFSELGFRKTKSKCCQAVHQLGASEMKICIQAD